MTQVGGAYPRWVELIQGGRGLSKVGGAYLDSIFKNDVGVEFFQLQHSKKQLDFVTGNQALERRALGGGLVTGKWKRESELTDAFLS